LKKRTKKLLRLRPANRVALGIALRGAERTKFFGSFFQKRTLPFSFATAGAKGR
jgi:hypothetical protein